MLRGANLWNLASSRSSATLRGRSFRGQCLRFQLLALRLRSRSEFFFKFERRFERRRVVFSFKKPEGFERVAPPRSIDRRRGRNGAELKGRASNEPLLLRSALLSVTTAVVLRSPSVTTAMHPPRELPTLVPSLSLL